MAVGAARVLVGRCRRLPRRNGGAAAWHLHNPPFSHPNPRPRLAPASRCLATAAAQAHARATNNTNGSSSGIANTGSINPFLRHPSRPSNDSHHHHDRTISLLISRRTLSVSPRRQDTKTPDREVPQAAAAAATTDTAGKGRVKGDGRGRRRGIAAPLAEAGHQWSAGDDGRRAGVAWRKAPWRKASGERLAARSGGGGGSKGGGEEPEHEGGAVDTESSRVWTVPNMITMGRICFCPVLAGLIVTSQHELALAGLLAASLTDWLDGYIARKWNQKSVLGGFLDPLADKIMVTTVALALGQEGIIPASLVTLMVGRDALLIAGSLAYRYRTLKDGDAFFDPKSVDYKVTPSTLSKVNTALQFGTLWLGLTNAVYLLPGDAAFSGLCVVTGAATLASGVNYLLVSGLKPRGRLGERLMMQRENLQERYREREVLIRERMSRRRERLRVGQGEFKDRLRARRKVVAGAFRDRISRGRLNAAATGEGVKGRFNRGRVTVEAIVAKHKEKYRDRARGRLTSKDRPGLRRGTGRDV